jgi:pantetheine-phosphate adenylyltransferase
MARKLAVYAGSFDPPTNGHLWMIERGAALFDILIVAVGVNPNKTSMFSINARIDILRMATKKFANVGIVQLTNKFLVMYAKAIDAAFILRGIRTESDYEYERVMRNVNSDLNPDITSVYLMPPRGIAELSSSMVKGLIGPDGWETIVGKYVPGPVLEKLREVHNARTK